MNTRLLRVGLSLAVGLGLALGQGLAADNSAKGGANLGALAERKPIFSEVLLLTNPAVGVTNPARLKALVEPRLVTNAAVIPAERERRGTTAVATPAAPASEDRGAAAASAPAAPMARGRGMESLDSKQKLGVGDRLTFRVLEDQEDQKPLTITDAGELDVPELGLVPAAGKTCKQLAYEIKGKLEQSTYYHATVILGIDLLNKTLSGRRVYVTGEVERTGPQEIPGGESWTVAKAIMRAGGFKAYANTKEVRLVRAGQQGMPGRTYIVNVAEVWSKGRTDQDLTVEAEDLIYVPRRGVVFY